MKGKKHVNAFLATTVFASVVPQTNAINAETSKEVKYTDIADSYAKNEIEYLTKAGKLYGMPNNLFEPYRQTTREEFAAILARLLDLESNPNGTKFDDVSPWAEGVVGALEDENIIAGYSDKKFGATDTLTREQMAVFFIRAMGYEEDAVRIGLDLKYADKADFSDWSKPIVAFATEIGLLVGFPDGKYYPKKETLRQDLAAVGYRFWSPEEETNPYVEKAKELIAKYNQELTLDAEDITPDNQTGYVVSGVTKPNQEVQVTVSHEDGEGDGKTQNVKSNADGYYEAKFDVSKFPGGEVLVSAQTWNKGEEEPEKVETIVNKGEVEDEGNGEGEVTLEVERMYPQGNETVVIEFKKEPKGDEVFYFNDEQVPAENVSYDGNIVELTVDTMKPGITYPVTVEDAEGGFIYKGGVFIEEVADVPSEIVASPSALSLQVGEEAKIKFTTKKADGGFAKNVEVRVQLKTTESGAEKLIEERVLNTDEKGEVEFTYTSIDERTDYVTAVAVKNPTVRTEIATTVIWSVAETGLITVTPKDDITKGEGVKREYTATFKDEASNPLTKNQKVYVYLGENASSTTEVGGDFVKINDKYAEATLPTDNGEVKLTVTDKAGRTVKPLFYFDKDGDNADHVIQGNDPRAQAGAVKYVKQTPVIALNDDGTPKIAVGNKKEVKLSVLDQYGDPYLGTIKIGVKESIDNINETLGGNIGYAYSANVASGQTFGGTVAGGEVNPTVINMKEIYDKGVPNGEVKIEVQGGSHGDIGNIVAFEDKNNDGLDATDYAVEKKVEFYQKKIQSVHIVGPQTVAVNADAVYELTFKDSEGREVEFDDELGSEIVIHVLDRQGNIVQDLTSSAHKVKFESDATTTADYAEGVTGAGFLAYQPTATDNIRKALVKINGDTEGQYTIRAFIDEKVGANAPNRRYEVDEAKGEAKLEIQQQVLTSGRIQVLNEFAFGGESKAMRYTIRDQSNQSMPAVQDTQVEFEIFNDGSSVTKVTLADNSVIALQPNERKTFEGTIERGKTFYSFSILSETTSGSVNVQVTGKVKGREDTATVGDILWVNATDNVGDIATSPIDRIHEGEVISYSEANTAGIKNWYVIKAGDRYYKIEYDTKTTNATSTQEFVVDNNTDVDGKLFEKTLTQGDIVKVEHDKATGKTKHILTNK